MTDSDIIQLWKNAGGGFYGPHVEHADMEYEKWLPFMRSFANDLLERSAAIAEAHPDDLRCEAVDPELLRGCCEAIAGQIRALKVRKR